MDCSRRALLEPGFEMMNIMNMYFSLRNRSDLHIQRFKYVYLSKHPLFIYPEIWNNLSQELKATIPLRAFKKKLKLQLFQEMFDET